MNSMFVLALVLANSCTRFMTTCIGLRESTSIITYGSSEEEKGRVLIKGRMSEPFYFVAYIITFTIFLCFYIIVHNISLCYLHAKCLELQSHPPFFVCTYLGISSCL